MCESPGFGPQLPMNRAQWHLVGGVQAILGCIVRPNPASKPKTPHSPGSWVMVRWALFMFFFYLGVWGWEGMLRLSCRNREPALEFLLSLSVRS